MKLFKQFIFMLFLPAVGAQADDRSERFAERRAWIEHAKSAKTPESMLNLARIVTGVGRNLDQASPEANDLFHAAQSTLLAIPGHAEYYRDRINEERAKLDALDVEANSVLWNEQRYRWKDAKNGFGVMGHLPSVETMRVLSDYIIDERGKIPIQFHPKPSYDEEVAWFESWPHCYNAMYALNALPIVSKPFKPTDIPIQPEELDGVVKSWQSWFEEIKSGRRTFRFEGDSTEYDLNGPAPKEKLERIARDRKRDAERAAGHKKAAESSGVPEPIATPASSKTTPIAILIAGMMLLASLAWYLLNARSRQNS